MSTIDGYESSTYANFDTEPAPSQDLPALPVDEVLPKANDDVTKKVTFEDSIQESNDANVILPKEDDEDIPKFDYMRKFMDYAPFVFALLFVLFAYWYSTTY